MHPTQLPAHVIDRVVFRRGRLHGFETIEPRKTALVVVDMQNVFCAKGAAVEVPAAREIVSNINRLARATRASGGVVVWIQMAVARWEDWALVLDNLLSPAVAQRTFEQIKPGSEGHALWPEMETDPADLFVAKNRYSAFLPSGQRVDQGAACARRRHRDHRRHVDQRMLRVLRTRCRHARFQDFHGVGRQRGPYR